MEKIVYCAIVYENKIIASYNTVPKLLFVIEKLVSTIDDDIDQKRSFGAHEKTYDHAIQYMVVNRMIYITSSTKGYPHSICFKLLETLQSEYKNRTSDDLILLENTIKRLVDFYSEGKEGFPILSKRGYEGKDIFPVFPKPYARRMTCFQKVTRFFSDWKNNTILALIVLLYFSSSILLFLLITRN